MEHFQEQKRRSKSSARSFIYILFLISAFLMITIAITSFFDFDNIKYEEEAFRASHPEYAEYVDAVSSYPWLRPEADKQYFFTEEEEAARSAWEIIATILSFSALAVSIFCIVYLNRHPDETESGEQEEYFMEEKELETIRSMVIHGAYSVMLKNGYGSDVFAAIKAEQNRLFDNYKSNKALLEKRGQLKQTVVSVPYKQSHHKLASIEASLIGAELASLHEEQGPGPEPREKEKQR